jgi:hypothetical protein
LAAGFYGITSLAKVGISSTYLDLGIFVFFYDISVFLRGGLLPINVSPVSESLILIEKTNRFGYKFR